MMEGRIQKTTIQGDATVESLDPDTVTKLLHYLDLTDPVTSEPFDSLNPLSLKQLYCKKAKVVLGLLFWFT